MLGPPCVVRSRPVVGLWGRFFVTLYRRATALICLAGCVAPPVRAYPGVPAPLVPVVVYPCRFGVWFLITVILYTKYN